MNKKLISQCLKNSDFRWGFFIINLYLWWLTLYFMQGYKTPENRIDLELLPPLSPGFILGTDIYGRSLFEVISQGIIYSFSMSFFISFLAATIGLFVGYIAVVGNNIIRYLCETIMNVIFIFPSILIAILIMSFFGSSFLGLSFALTFTGWAAYARITRGEVKRILGLPYVEAARALGMGPVRLFFSVIFPALLPQLIVHLVLGLSGVIVSEAALGFLGLGGSAYSWGGLLSMGKTVLLEAPHLSITISLVMASLIIALNLIGDGLRDILDPNLRK